jgi:tRNA G18 (ribose-2'-O)-methylase SpoU
MPVIHIGDARDPRIADYGGVSDPELLRRRGLFVAENRLVVRTLLMSTRFRTRSVLVTDAAYVSLQDALEPFTPSLPIYVCPKALMEPVSGYHIHRGCLALGERPAAVSVAGLLADVPDARTLVVLEAITNADNVGAIFRNGRAFGVDGVVIGPRCCDPLYRKAIRVSIGATLVVPFGVGTQSDPPYLPALKRAGFTLVALTPACDAVDLNDFAAEPLPGKIALLVGNEGEGLSVEAQRAGDVRVRITMAPGVDSLNVSTATGIALHRLWSSGFHTFPRGVAER